MPVSRVCSHRWTRRWTQGAAFAWVAPAAIWFGLATAGCRDAAREEAELALRDQAALEQIVNHDLELDRIVKDADDAAEKGDAPRAVALLETKAAGAADATLAAANR